MLDRAPYGPHARVIAVRAGTALSTRAVIEQAKGIVMGSRHCPAEQAFLLLAQASQRQNRKLHEIAAEIVERSHLSPTPQT